MAEKIKSQNNEEVITINIQPFLVPISILLSAIIFSTSMFFGLNNIADALSGGSKSNNADSADSGDTVADTEDTTIEEGVTDIDDDPVLGDSDNAKVAIVEFSDYECPFCQRFHTDGTYDQIIENFVDTGDAIFVFRDFPLSFHEPAASKAANAAACIDDLKGDEAFFSYTAAYYEATAANGEGVSDEEFTQLAKDTGVNIDDFNECVDEERFADDLEHDTTEGGSAGVTGTPGFIVGVLKEDGTVEGELVSGAQPYSVFEAAIERQLEAAN